MNVSDFFGEEEDIQCEQHYCCPICSLSSFYSNCCTNPLCSIVKQEVKQEENETLTFEGTPKNAEGKKKDEKKADIVINFEEFNNEYYTPYGKHGVPANNPNQENNFSSGNNNYSTIFSSVTDSNLTQNGTNKQTNKNAHVRITQKVAKKLQRAIYHEEIKKIVVQFNLQIDVKEYLKMFSYKKIKNTSDIRALFVNDSLIESQQEQDYKMMNRKLYLLILNDPTTVQELSQVERGGNSQQRAEQYLKISEIFKEFLLKEEPEKNDFLKWKSQRE